MLKNEIEVEKHFAGIDVEFTLKRLHDYVSSNPALSHDETLKSLIEESRRDYDHFLEHVWSP